MIDDRPATAGPVTLVLRALGLGDLLTGVPALRAVRRGWPEDWLQLAAPAALRPLVELIGTVDELVPVAGLCQFGADYRHYREQVPDRRPHRVVNLHGSGPQSIRCLQRLGAAEMITHAHPDCPDVPGPPWRQDLHEIDRWCALLENHQIPTDRNDLRIGPAAPSPCPGVTVVHPGASYRSRRWPPSRFADVARTLADEGHRIVITGTAQERKLCRWAAERAGLPEDVVWAGQTDLAELAAVVAGAELVICGDTGTGHLATALDTPSVLLFGPTPPSRWGPTVDTGRHIALWSGHVGDPLGGHRDAGLLDLQVDDVLDQAHRLLPAA